MSRRLVLSILAVLILLIPSLALTCSCDLLSKAGTCANQTWTNFNGQQIYYCCKPNPFYIVNNETRTEAGFIQCYATISSQTITTPPGTIVADAITTSSTKLNECSGYNGVSCDVNPVNGFNATGICDSSDANCVICNSNKVETNAWLGGVSINGSGDNKCESGCGANAKCDEKSIGERCQNDYCQDKRLYDFNGDKSLNGANCSSSCLCNDTLKSNYCDTGDCGADSACNDKIPGDICGQDYCQNGRLYDYNGNNQSNYEYCSTTCGCDTVLDGSYCNSANCSADIECNGRLPGYYVPGSNAGCTNLCDWNSCGNYKWNSTLNSCLTSCSSTSDCFGAAKCYLPNSQCIIDTEAPKYDNYTYNDLTPTPDNTLIDGDVLEVRARWTDNIDVDSAILQINKTGNFENITLTNIYDWASFLVQTTGLGEKDITYRVFANDTSGNWNVTSFNTVHVYTPTTTISVSLNEKNSTIPDVLEFSCNSSGGSNIVAMDSGANNGKGDIRITHSGIGTMIGLSFRINTTYAPGMTAKIGNIYNNPASAVTISNIDSTPAWCQNLLPGQNCEVYMWVDCDGTAYGRMYSYSLIITSEMK